MNLMNDDAAERLRARSYDISQEPLTLHKPICLHPQTANILLDQAIEPLTIILPKLPVFVSIAKTKCNNPADELTQDESASIMLYTMHWQPMEECLYHNLNAALRSNDEQKLKPWLLFLQLLIQALSRLPSISSIVYRQFETDLTERYPTGNTFVWWSFPLCSLSLDSYQVNKRICTIFSIESYSAKDIRKHAYFPNEDQIILMTASKFQVISSLTSKDNQYIIFLKEHQPIDCQLQRSNISNEHNILSAAHLLNTSGENIQSKLRVETIQKYIERTLALQNHIQKYQKYSSIELMNSNIDDQDIPTIVQHAIIKMRCTILRLDNNYITYEGASILANSLHNNETLVGLNLNSNRLLDKGLNPFVQLLSMNHSVLQKLHIGSNGISDAGARLLADMLQTNTTLIVLWLDHNRIGNNGVHYLAHTLAHHNTTLKELSFNSNKLITSVSVPYFIDMLQYNRTLKHLDISKCSLTPQDNMYLTTKTKENEEFILEVDRSGDCSVS